MIFSEPDSAYHARTEVSSTMLRTLLRSPALLHYRESHPQEPSSAMSLGTAVHAAILERRTVQVAPDRRTKAGKDEAAELEKLGAILLPAAQMEAFEAMRLSWEASPLSRLKFAAVEQTCTWHEDMPDGAVFFCRARFDALLPDGRTIIDLKTTRDPSPRGFAKSCADYGYIHQAAWYMLGAQRNGIEHPRFLFVAIGSEPPYQVAAYSPSIDDLARAEQQMLAALEEYSARIDSGSWSDDWQDRVNNLEMPVWWAKETTTE